MSPATMLPVLAPTWLLIGVLAVIVVLFGVLGTTYLRHLYAVGGAANTWLSFFAGPGALQVASLTMGMLLASLGIMARPVGETTSDAAAVMQWHANAVPQPTFTTNYIDVEHYRYLTVLSRVTAPTDGHAVVVIYGVDASGRIGEVRRIEATSTAWSAWQGSNRFSRLRIGLDHPAARQTIATAVDITLVLQQAPPAPLQETQPPLKP